MRPTKTLIDDSASGVFVVETREGQKVVVVGIGNVGGKIVLSLLAAGVPPGQIVIIDFDTIESHNIANQLNGCLLGIAKVDGLKSTVRHLYGDAAADAILTYQNALGEDNEDFPLDAQRDLVQDSILILAIDSPKGMKNIYNNVLLHATPDIVCAANFSKIYRDDNGNDASGKITLMPDKIYFRKFCESFANSALEISREDTTPACKQPNCSLPGELASALLVQRLMMFLRHRAKTLPASITNNTVDLTGTTGIVFEESEFIDENEDAWTNYTPVEPAVDYICSVRFDLANPFSMSEERIVKNAETTELT
mgnify:FL=1